jgi:hypothetical protein
MLSETNKLMVYDPHKPHISEPFSGTRFALTYSHYPSTNELKTSGRMRALKLGFNLNLAVGDLVTLGRSATDSQNIDPLVAVLGTEHHMVPPESTPKAVETVVTFSYLRP